MTNALTTQPAQATSVPSDLRSEAGPDFASHLMSSERPQPEKLALVDQSGRSLGVRAVKTRLRILEATTALLDEKSMRDLRVIDIARRIGSSPATFYQYFKDVEDVVLELVHQLNSRSPEFHDLISGDWSGRDGHARGRELASRLVQFWGDNASLLRVRNNAAEEGNEAFVVARNASQAPIITLFSKLVEEAHPVTEYNEEGEWRGGKLYPVSAAFVLLSSIEGLIVSRNEIGARFGDQNESHEEIIETLATFLQMMLA